MQDARKLVVYGEARELAIAIYRLTLGFSPEERFGLTQQLRRAAVSVGSNIAEGCGRKGSRALAPFLYYAIGSAKELEFQIELAVRRLAIVEPSKRTSCSNASCTRVAC